MQLKEQMEKTMEIKDMKQGSPQWLEMRKTKITSTDASIINGTNTFNGNSPYKLWQRKLGLADEQPVNAAMIEGSILEETARNWFNESRKVSMKPAIFLNSEHQWIMASLDGYNEHEDYILEIKCGIKAYELAEKDKIPPYSYDQIQHALFASGKSQCIYMSYRVDKNPIIITVNYDHDYMASLLEKEKEFYECLKDMTPPPLGEKDYVVIDSTEANKAAKRWKKAKEILDEAKIAEQEAKKFLLEETDDGACIFPSVGVRVERVHKQGAVDWKKVCIKWEIDEHELEAFRKQSIGYPRITLIKK